MAKPTSRCLVIDTDVARAAGGEECEHPTGRRSRDFLIAVLTICHRVVLTPEIKDEWSRHQSGFARKWRVRMMARRKVANVEPTPNQSLRDRLQHVAATDREREAIAKDFPLVEAALAADGIVASKETVIRQLFNTVARKVGELRQIVWVNPDQPDEDPIGWLEGGAQPEDRRKLGRQP
jgi:hypothetical protein